jgi:tRNA dimethylallyltransferase
MVAAPILVIVGETASGKSKLAMDIALEFNGEIICADAWTIRKQADIGTAKPSKRDQTLIKHHLLNIIEPNEGFSAARFKELANQAINEIHARDKLPIMVGGSGLYIDAVVYDYNFLPSANTELRDYLNNLSISQLLQIIEKDKVSIKDIDLKNKRRLIRLIETKGELAKKNELTDNLLILGLLIDRKELKENITKRLDVMIAAGLIDEVRGLEKNYGWDCPALQAVGYREWRSYLKGEETLELVKQKIIKNNMELTKKQRTWFKRNKSIHWISTEVKYTVAVDILTSYLHSI